ncbi:MAG: hypothetical protein JO372_13805 [Solirubrobacterales bacterium]|nr:hypothetical protein [Solirubrobacterales bacterium]
MSESTLEAPSAQSPRISERRRVQRRSPLPLLRAHPWWLVALVLVGVSIGLVEWSNTRPGYDPYGWLVWGYQTLHLSLDLGGAPSWKPLPYFFTVPFALFGHLELRLWMVTSVLVSLAGSIFAARIAYRLVGMRDGDRRPALLAAAFAGLGLLGIENYLHFILSVQADTMIVSLCLAAIDMHLSGHPRWALFFGVLASIGRPEAWAWLAPWTLWMWIKNPPLRRLLVAGWLFILFMWFGVPTITNGRPLLAEQLALRSPREIHGENKIIGTFHRFTELTYLPFQLLALFATALAYVRRNWTILALAIGAVTWVVVETILVLRGLPGVPRYMFEAAGVTTVVAAVGIGWMLREALRFRARVPRWAGVTLVAAICAVMVPAAVSRVRAEHADLKHERGRTKVIGELQAAINHVGGYRAIRDCGEPVTNIEYASILAYFTKLNVGVVGYLPHREIRSGKPIVMFTQLPNGWLVQPIHTARSHAAACAQVNAFWIYTPRHPNGVVYSHR